MGLANIDNTANSAITANTAIPGITGNTNNIAITAKKKYDTANFYNFDGSNELALWQS